MEGGRERSVWAVQRTDGERYPNSTLVVFTDFGTAIVFATVPKKRLLIKYANVRARF